VLIIDAERSDAWYTGNKVHTKAHEKLPYEIAMEKNAIPYDENPALWHWSHRVRPVRCATDLTIYRNTTSDGVTVCCAVLAFFGRAMLLADHPACLLAGYGLWSRRANFLQGHVWRNGRALARPQLCHRPHDAL